MPTTDQGQVFRLLRAELERYSPPLTVRIGSVEGKDDYHLWSEREVVIEGRKRDEVFFAGLIAQKGYVGLYYMPVYAEPELETVFEPELRALLRGKSCFHLKRLDDRLLAQVRSALERGFALWRGRDWID